MPWGTRLPSLSSRCICHLGNPTKTALHIRMPLSLVARSSSVESVVAMVGKWVQVRKQANLWEDVPASFRLFVRLLACHSGQEGATQQSHSISRCVTTFQLGFMGRFATHKWDPVERTWSWKIVQNLTMLRSTAISKQTTSCGKFSRPWPKNTECSSMETVFSRNCNPWTMRKAAFAGRQSRIEKTETVLGTDLKKTLRRSLKHVWTSCRNGSRQTMNWNQPAKNKEVQAKQEMAKLVAEQTAENAKAVSQGNPGVQTQFSAMSDNAAQQTVLSGFESVLTMHSLGCHSV